MKICDVHIDRLARKPLGNCFLLHLPQQIGPALAVAAAEVIAQQRFCFEEGTVFRADYEILKTTDQGAINAEGLPAGSCVVLNVAPLAGSDQESNNETDLLRFLNSAITRYGGARVSLLFVYTGKGRNSAWASSVIAAAAAAGLILVDIDSAEAAEALDELGKLYMDDVAALLAPILIEEAEDLLYQSGDATPNFRSNGKE